MMQKIGVKGRVTVTVDGEVVRRVDNLILNNGLGVFAALLADKATKSSVTLIEAGAGTTAPTATDTETEDYYSDAATANSNSGAGASFAATFAVGDFADDDITEATLWADTDIISRVVFAAVTVAETEELVIQWDITYQRV